MMVSASMVIYMKEFSGIIIKEAAVTDDLSRR